MDMKATRWPWLVVGMALFAFAVGAAFRMTYLAEQRRAERRDAYHGRYFDRLMQIATETAREFEEAMEAQGPLPADLTPEEREVARQQRRAERDRWQEEASRKFRRESRAADRGYDRGPAVDYRMLITFFACALASVYCFARADRRFAVGWSLRPTVRSVDATGRWTYVQRRLLAAVSVVLGLTMAAVVVCAILPNASAFGNRKTEIMYVFGISLVACAAIGCGLLGLFLPKTLTIDPRSRRVLYGRRAKKLRESDYSQVRLVLRRGAPFGLSRSVRWSLTALLPGFHMVLHAGFQEEKIREEAEEIAAATGLRYESVAPPGA